VIEGAGFGHLILHRFQAGTDNDGSASGPVRQTVAREYPGPVSRRW